MSAPSANTRPAFDKVISDIADYVVRYRVKSPLALETAHYCLIDSLGCGFEALAYPACTKLLGPLVPGTIVPHGAREEIMNAVPNAWPDGHPLAVFRRKPNTGSRKSWPVGDAASRSVRQAALPVNEFMDLLPA